MGRRCSDLINAAVAARVQANLLANQLQTSRERTNKMTMLPGREEEKIRSREMEMHMLKQKVALKLCLAI